MHENQPTVSPNASGEDGRKAWTTPVVSILSIDETAISTFGGNDGNGTTTAS